MLVRDLIAKLKELPQDAEVLLPAAEEGANTVEVVMLLEATRHKYDPHWAYGNYSYEDYLLRHATKLTTVVVLFHNEDSAKEAYLAS